jgi:hypothetical protein
MALKVNKPAPGLSAFNDGQIVSEKPSVSFSDDSLRSFGSRSIVVFNLLGCLIGAWPRAIHSSPGYMAPMKVISGITHSHVLCAHVLCALRVRSLF